MTFTPSRSLAPLFIVNSLQVRLYFFGNIRPAIHGNAGIYYKIKSFVPGCFCNRLPQFFIKTLRQSRFFRTKRLGKFIN